MTCILGLLAWGFIFSLYLDYIFTTQNPRASSGSGIGFPAVAHPKKDNHATKTAVVSLPLLFYTQNPRASSGYGIGFPAVAHPKKDNPATKTAVVSLPLLFLYPKSTSKLRILGIKKPRLPSRFLLRRERDSNPRTCYSQWFSRPPHSTTLPSLP